MDDVHETSSNDGAAAPAGEPRRGTLPDYVDRNEAKRRRQMERIDARLAQAALSGKQSRRMSPWQTSLLGWAIAAVVLGAAVWGVHTFINRDRVVEPAAVGGLPVSTSPDLVDFANQMQAERPVVGGLDYTQMTVTPYGTGDDFAIVWIWPSGGLMADQGLVKLAAEDDTLTWSPVEQVGSSRCITGRSADDDSGSVFCQRAGTDLSVLVQTGIFPDTERTAAMVDEVWGQQPDA
jgi:hypothetical protein